VRANTDYSPGHPNKSLYLYKETRNLLAQYRIFPKKRLGQNFAIDDALLRSIISYADLGKNDVVLEIGAGLGFLTRLLSPNCKKVVAVEVDLKLVSLLNVQLRHLPNVELTEGDVLSADIPPFNKVVSTPPYSISSPLLFWMLNKPFNLAVLTFQEEFAKRLTATVGSRDYSRLTVSVYYRAEVELLDLVSKSSFYPSPDVDSIIVRLKPKPAPFKVKNEKAFFEMIQTVFTQRNKKLRNAVLSYVIKQGLSKDKAQRFADGLTFHDKRVRELAPEDFGALSNEILEKTNLVR
jgi:16S rRNA (adenine1518-N6/adenine1519-N6)-dimethyltransferase